MTPLDTVKENLLALEEDGTRVSEKKLYELSELSRIVYERIKDDLRGEEVESLFHRGNADGFLFDPSMREEIPSEYLFLLGEVHRLSFSAEICAFSIFLSERIRAGGEAVLPFREVKTARARIAYVPAGKAEQAYFALARARREATVHYVDSAAEAVAALLSHRADFALLPYRSAKGEALPGIHRLWVQNDLSLSALVTVSEGEEKLVYALFSTELSPYVQKSPMALCFQITADSYAHLGRILSALSVFGYTQTELTAEGEEYGRVRARVALGGEGDIQALWLYLSLYSAGASPLGRYPILET